MSPVTSGGGLAPALRPACRLAMDVARVADGLDAWGGPPGALVPILRFRRLNAAAYQTVGRVLEDDENFRLRVAAVADEDEIGRAGWLWLERPDNWQDEPAWRVATGNEGTVDDRVESVDDDNDGDGDGTLAEKADIDPSDENVDRPLSKDSGGRSDATATSTRAAKADAAAERHRRKADEAAGRLRKSNEELAQARLELSEARSEAEALRGRIGTFEAERNQAMRKYKALETDLSETRSKLRLARAATTEAEAELQSLRSGRLVAPAVSGSPLGGRNEPRSPEPADPSFDSRDGTRRTVGVDDERSGRKQPTPGEGEPPWDRGAVAGAIADAAQAAQSIARSLDAAASALANRGAEASTQGFQGETQGVGVVGATGAFVSAESPAGGRSSPTTAPSSRRATGRRKGRGGRIQRAKPSLPPGVFDASPEADRHLLAAGEALVLVDGYNVARTTWPELDPEEERRRLVRLLEDLQARSRGRITVVFDGDTSAVAPRASRSVHVVFSATGVTADDDIARRLADVPVTQPVVVVSSDGEVMADARRQGAVAMPTPAFLAAAGR